MAEQLKPISKQIQKITLKIFIPRLRLPWLVSYVKEGSNVLAKVTVMNEGIVKIGST